MNSKKNNKNSPVSDSVLQPEQRSEFNSTDTQPAPEQKSDSRMKGKPHPAQNVRSTKDSDPTL